MANDMKQVVRQEETVVAGTPPQAVVTQTPVVTPAGTVPAQTVVAQTPVPSDRVVSQNVSEAVHDPAGERAANVDWFSRVIWFLVGTLAVLLAIRFVLLLTGANEAAGF